MSSQPFQPTLTFTHHNAFGARYEPKVSLVERLLAVAIFRSWYLVLIFGLWSTLITVIDMKSDSLELHIPDGLLMLVGSAIGFITTFRAGQSIERWNEGRMLWANMMQISRVFGRVVWFQVNEKINDPNMSEEEQRARSLIEKKTALNLLEAYCVALKHYLRGEDGIYYTDLYHLVKFLPSYSLPGNIDHDDPFFSKTFADDEKTLSGEEDPKGVDPVNEKTPLTPRFSNVPITPVPRDYHSVSEKESHEILSQSDEIFLVPGYKPPSNLRQIFDFWPVNSIIEANKRRREKKAVMNGKRAAKLRAKMLNRSTTHNLPLEILIYLHSYVAALASRKTQENATINTMYQNLTQLTDALSNMERIVSTPIPWSYRIHLWTVLSGWLILMPFQVVAKMGWWTIAGGFLFPAIFFSFLVIGEELENPFGYDKNDLNMDYYTNRVIRNELDAISSTACPEPAEWIFIPSNDLALAGARCDSNRHNGPEGGCHGWKSVARISPDEWIQKGPTQMETCLGDISVRHGHH